MATLPKWGKFHTLFTLFIENGQEPVSSSPRDRRVHMVGIAIAMFIALFGWGAGYFGWSDPDHKIQLALAASFILGILSGYKVRGS
jgi:hypothetical protein